MKERAFVEAISEARRELEQVKAQILLLSSLHDRQRMLEQFLLVAEQLVDTDRGPMRRDEIPSAAAILRDTREAAEVLNELQPERLWVAIQLVMGVRKEPMTAREVLDALTREKFKVHGDHKRETVRSSMIRKPEIFQKIGRGLFALAEWPKAMKQPRKEEPEE